MKMKTLNTVCPRNCYSNCGFKVKVENNKVIGIDPLPTIKTTPNGPCLKGQSYVERANSDARIRYPLKKINGRFNRISWDEVLNLISNRLSKIREENNQHSVLYYSASGMFGLTNSICSKFWELFGGATTVYGSLCWAAGLEATRLTLGEIKHNIAWDLENAKLIILWGKNPAETNIQQMIFIEKAIEKGAKLVVVDPRRTKSYEIADLLVQPIPGTDAILALAIAKILIVEKKIDNNFIDKHVLGFDEFSDKIKEIDINEASRKCGISVTFIKKLAKLIAETTPMTIVPGYGFQRFSNGGQTTRSILALQIITGNIGKNGACWHYADLQSDIFSSTKEPLSYYPSDEKSVFRRKISTAKLGEDMLNINSPKLKMGWIERGNPITQSPDSHTVIKAFEKLDFLVVVEQFMTDTARLADIILPAKNMFEQSDIIVSYWNPYIQFRPKVVEPEKEIKTEIEIYRLLAKKMNFDTDDIKNNFPENDLEIEKFLEDKISAYQELSIEKLKKEPILAPNLQKIAFCDYIFPTPSGKIELLSQQAEKMWNVNKLPTYKKPIEGFGDNEKYPFQLMSPNTKNRIHSQFGNLKSIKAVTNEPVAIINIGDAQKKGIKNGDKIKVFNDRGELIIKVELNASIRPGCISIANGFWHSEKSCPNILSKGRETDMGHGTAFHDNLVDYKKM